MSTESLPRRIGKYELRQKLGQGGMGTVYRALEIGLNRSVAVKLMKSEYRDNATIRQRFSQEARAVAALDHPHIIKIFYFDDEPELYLVMEFVPSGSLRGYLRHHQEDGTVLEVREGLRLTRQIADALQVAHSQHMIHRDIKPDNVLLKSLTVRRQTTFHPLLTDFGLVKLAEAVGFQTQPGTAIGTFAYMSPEQLKGSAVDHRTDLYALGIMLFELVVGRLPFNPKTPSQAYDMHHYQEPPVPSDLRPGISPALENLILQAIAKNPNDRFQTALDMSEALLDIESGESDHLTQLDSMASHGGQLESLSHYMTALPGTPVDDEVSRLDTPQNLANDRIAIQKVGDKPIYVEMTRPTFIIGRTDDADITLPTNQVSRQHARINRRRDGTYTITDLGSTNRTFIDGVELLSDVPEPWSTAQLVSIGEFRLSLQLAAGMQDTHPDMAKPSMEGLAFPSGDTAPRQGGGHLHTMPQSAPVIVQLSPATVTVQAGSPTTVNLTLRSMATTVEHYQVEVRGIPAEWVSVPTTPLQLMPGSSGSIPITLRPPQDTTTAAGDYHYRVRVSSHERGTDIASTDGSLTIPPYYRFTTDMMPQRITPGKIINLTLENKGNSPEQIIITPRDRAAAVSFDPPTATLALNPGQREVLRIRPRPIKSKWIGTPELFPLEIRATALSGHEQIQAGELVVKPRLPTWMAGILSLVCAGLVMFGAYVGFIRDDNKPTSELSAQDLTATANAHATETAVAQTNEILANTLTVMVFGGDSEKDAIQNALSTAQDETGLSFEVSAVDVDEFNRRMENGGDDGDIADIVVASDDLLWSFAAQGVLTPLDLGNTRSNFTEASLSTVTLNGDLYGVPYGAHTLALVCNQDMVEAEGFPLPISLIEIFEAELIRFAMPMDAYHFAPYLHAFGGYYFGMDSNGNYDVNDVGITHEAGVDGLYILLGMAEHNTLIEATADPNTVFDSFLGQKAACAIIGSWYYPQLAESGILYDVEPIRLEPEGEPGATWLTVSAFAVPVGSPHQEQAVEILRDYVTQESFQAELVEATQRPSVYKPLLTDDTFESLNGFALVAEYGKRAPLAEMEPYWSDIQDILQRLVNFEISAEEAAEILIATLQQ